MNFLIKKLCDLLVLWCEKNNRVFKIYGDNNDDVYLVRYIVFKSRFGCIYIHRFLRSDADDPHDHPFCFLTYVISKGYTEVCYDRGIPIIKDGSFNSLWTRVVKKRKPGTFAYRRDCDIHQVVVDKDRNIKDIKDAPYTICFIGPRRKEWNFYPLEMRGTGSLDWREYLNMVPKDPRTKGSE
jgi:hypothetical protein